MHFAISDQQIVGPISVHFKDTVDSLPNILFLQNFGVVSRSLKVRVLSANILG